MTIPELAKAIGEILPRPVCFMEVCGTHTVNIFRFGLRSLFPPELNLISGPGCPVCVTPPEEIDYLIELSRLPGVAIATFGDLLRIPGSRQSLKESRAEGNRLYLVYSPLDALKLAEEHPQETIIFAAFGFETTAPAVAVAVLEAKKRNLKNLLFAVSHRTMPAALKSLLSSGELMLDGLLLPGHVSTITGARYFSFVVEEFRLPAVVAGFEARHIMRGLFLLAKQVAEKKVALEIEYKEAVSPEGNVMGQQLIRKVFEPCDAYWRGLGLIPGSGLKLREEYANFDARRIFPLEIPPSPPPKGCLCGEILCGRKRPPDCKLFGRQCTPETPKGPCMVSMEGTCAAWYAYGEDSSPPSA